MQADMVQLERMLNVCTFCCSSGIFPKKDEKVEFDCVFNCESLSAQMSERNVIHVYKHPNAIDTVCMYNVHSVLTAVCFNSHCNWMRAFPIAIEFYEDLLDTLV